MADSNEQRPRGQEQSAYNNGSFNLYYDNPMPPHPSSSLPRAPSRATRDDTPDRRHHSPTMSHIFHRTAHSPLRRSALRHYLGSSLYVPYVTPIGSDRAYAYLEQLHYLHAHIPGVDCALAFRCERFLIGSPQGRITEMFVPARWLDPEEEDSPVPDHHRDAMDFTLALRPGYRAWLEQQEMVESQSEQERIDTEIEAEGLRVRNERRENDARSDGMTQPSLNQEMIEIILLKQRMDSGNSLGRTARDPPAPDTLATAPPMPDPLALARAAILNEENSLPSGFRHITYPDDPPASDHVAYDLARAPEPVGLYESTPRVIERSSGAYQSSNNY